MGVGRGALPLARCQLRRRTRGRGWTPCHGVNEDGLSCCRESPSAAAVPVEMNATPLPGVWGAAVRRSPRMNPAKAQATVAATRMRLPGGRRLSGWREGAACVRDLWRPVMVTGGVSPDVSPDFGADVMGPEWNICVAWCPDMVSPTVEVR